MDPPSPVIDGESYRRPALAHRSRVAGDLFHRRVLSSPPQPLRFAAHSARSAPFRGSDGPPGPAPLYRAYYRQGKVDAGRLSGPDRDLFRLSLGPRQAPPGSARID